MSRHQPQPVMPFTGSPFDLDGREFLISSSAIERLVDIYEPLRASLGEIAAGCSVVALVTEVMLRCLLSG
jgi:hypothetical protein